MSSEQGVSRYYAVAGDHRDGSYVLVILRRTDGHEVWGDQPLPAPKWADIPAAATRRLAGTDFHLTGEWREAPATAGGPIHGPSWQADADIR